MAKIRESFRWLTQFEAFEKDGRMFIQGEALHAGESANRVLYGEDELLRAARTLAGKPLYLNHLETAEQAARYMETKKDEVADPMY